MAQEIADSTLLDTWASSGLIVEPDISKIIEGWQLGEQPPHEYMNWLQNTFGSKLNHILKNGVAKWNNETEYLAGSSVQHNGFNWTSKATNSNSEPADVNANWKRIITVDSLTPTIATGTATFNSTTNNINLTGIGIGVEIGDVIQISGANDAKNNSEFTVEVIIDNNNIIVNQAHANKGTTKNVANRSGDTGVTVKLLAKWYNAPLGLGQGWVDVKSTRSNNTDYPNNTNRTIQIAVTSEETNSQDIYLLINGINIYTQGGPSGVSLSVGVIVDVPHSVNYKVFASSGTTPITKFFELR